MRALTLALLYVSAGLPLAGQTGPGHTKTYALHTWRNIMCRAKGRFQDREYCASAVMDRIVADGKAAIPVLISQIADPRWIKDPVYDFWPRIRTGELAYFILSDLFLDDTWESHTMPALFPTQHCDADAPSSVCWQEFRKTHSLEDLQAKWMEFWKANQDKIYWDGKARCFRLRAPLTSPPGGGRS